MAKPSTTTEPRLRQLIAARDKARKFKRGETLTASPMAELIGVSWPTLRKWCNDIPGFAESGAFVGGSNGIEYAFSPRKSLDYLVKHFEAERAAALEKTRKVRRIVGGDSIDGIPEDFDLDQISKMVRVAGQIRDERERQGQLVDAALVRQTLREMFSRMQQAGLRAAVEHDPSGQWPAHMREAFEDAINSVLLSIEAAGRDCLSTIRGGSA